jgi:hypothetical protein
MDCKLTDISASAYKLDGIKSFEIKINKILTPWFPYLGEIQTSSIFYSFQQLVENDLPFGNVLWDRGAVNKCGASYSIIHDNSHQTKFTITGELSFNSITNYSRIKLEYNQTFDYLPFSFRIFTGFTSNTPPLQEKFYLASANPVEQLSNPLYRSILFLNKNFQKDANLNMAGGGNISSKTKNLITGNNLASFNIETKTVSMDNLGIDIPVVSEFKILAFANFSNIWDSGYKDIDEFFRDFYVESGFSVVFNPFYNDNILTGIISELKNINIKFNFPLFINRTPKNEQYFDWRWNISIGKVISF